MLDQLVTVADVRPLLVRKGTMVSAASDRGKTVAQQAETVIGPGLFGPDPGALLSCYI